MSNDVIDQALAGYDKFRQLVEELFQRAKDTLEWIPDALAHLIKPIQDGLAFLRAKVAELVAGYERFERDKGDPDKLRAYAAEWGDKFTQRLDNVAEVLDPASLKTAVHWSGRAAETYKIALAEQLKKVDAAKELGRQMRDSLTNLANAIETFWLTFDSIIWGLVGATAAAIASAATVVGLPAAVGILSAEVAAGIPAVFAVISVIDTTVDTINNELVAIHDKANDLGDGWSQTDTSTMSHPDDWRTFG
jgi:uncharacterized membrane protein YccF (DUF307 family)